MAFRWKSGIRGVIAGIAGALAMHQFRLIWDRRRQASPASGIFGFDEEADLNAVDQLWNRLSLPALSREEALRAALVMHYAYGAVAGGAYAVFVDNHPAARTGSGSLFGALLWLFGDEIAVAVSRLSNPAQKTRSSHVSALAVHLLFGTVTEFSRKFLSKSAQRRARLAQ